MRQEIFIEEIKKLFFKDINPLKPVKICNSYQKTKNCLSNSTMKISNPVSDLSESLSY